MRTTFEQGAHDIQHKKRRNAPHSHPHIIETYTSGNPSTFITVLEIAATAIIGTILMVLLMAVFPD